MMTETLANICIYTFGTFSFERRREDGTWEVVSPLAEGPVTHENHTKSVLGYLLCCPRRQALRAQIVSDLWDMECLSGDEYLRKVTPRLRKLLEGEPFFQLTDNKQRFTLADQALIWTDKDHCLALMAEVGKGERTTPAAIARLEEAERLFRRGKFLPNEASFWFYPHREELLTLFFHCRQYLAEAYHVQGLYSQEEHIASEWLREQPLNETALQHVMQALHAQGATYEALRRYRDTATLAKKMGNPLPPEMEAFAKQLSQQPRRQTLPPEEGTSASASTDQNPEPSTRATSVTTPAATEQTADGVSCSFPNLSIEDTMLGREVLAQGKNNMDPLRRNLGVFLKQAAQVSLGSAFASDLFGGTDLLERLVHAVKRPSSTDTILLAELRSSVTQCWKLQPEIVGIVSFEHLTQVHAHLTYLIELLESSLYPSVRQQLSSLAAECSLIIGVLYFDMGLLTAAERYFTAAYRVAEEAGHLAVQAVIRGWMSMLPDHSHSLAFLEEALPLADKYGTDTTYSWLQARNAEVYVEHLSENGKYATKCEKALEQATTFSAKGDPEHDPYWTCFDENLMYGYQGACYIKLQKPEDAKKALLQALQLSNPRNIHRQALFQIDFARVYQLQGDIPNACLCGHRALSLISQAHSPGLLRRLETFRSNFTAGQADTAIQAFDEHKRSVEELLRHRA